MSPKREQIPLYGPDGTSLGFRSPEAAKRLIEGGYVKPAYGRKGHLRALWLLQQDGANPVETLRAGNPDVQGLCLALMDWSAELRILESERRMPPKNSIA